jgi:putative SOS response-associated peptidase YedK
MCGRFVRTSSRDVLASESGITTFVNVDLSPRYNVAPIGSAHRLPAFGDSGRNV